MTSNEKRKYKTITIYEEDFNKLKSMAVEKIPVLAEPTVADKFAKLMEGK
jgi:hypothetical protein